MADNEEKTTVPADTAYSRSIVVYVCVGVLLLALATGGILFARNRSAQIAGNGQSSTGTVANNDDKKSTNQSSDNGQQGGANGSGDQNTQPGQSQDSSTSQNNTSDSGATLPNGSGSTSGNNDGSSTTTPRTPATGPSNVEVPATGPVENAIVVAVAVAALTLAGIAYLRSERSLRHLFTTLR